jgi:hypothetical protein
MQIYATATLGALGGLIGWMLVGSIATGAWWLWLAYPVVGAGLGACIGGFVAAADGALVQRSVRRALRDGLAGAIGGALAGAIGLILAGILFLALDGGYAGRMAGWMLLGAAIGLGELAVGRQRVRALHGALGGAIGGIVGGALYEGLTQLFRAQSDQAQLIVGGVGLMVVGAAIGACIPLARQFLAGGALQVLAGAQSGLVRDIDEEATIGGYDGCDLYLPDEGVAWRHARVQRHGGEFRFEVLQGAIDAVVDARRVAAGEHVVLRGGERIAIGAAELLFIGRA